MGGWLISGAVLVSGIALGIYHERLFHEARRREQEEAVRRAEADFPALLRAEGERRRASIRRSMEKVERLIQEQERRE